MYRMLVPFALVLSLAPFAACSREADVDSPTSGAADVNVLAWEALTPSQWHPKANTARSISLPGRMSECFERRLPRFPIHRTL